LSAKWITCTRVRPSAEKTRWLAACTPRILCVSDGLTTIQPCVSGLWSVACSIPTCQLASCPMNRYFQIRYCSSSASAVAQICICPKSSEKLVCMQCRSFVQPIQPRGSASRERKLNKRRQAVREKWPCVMAETNGIASAYEDKET
jgi:hypothetical protein